LPELDATQWAFAVVVGLVLGFTKTGVAGMGILVVPLMATIFPVKESVGILLPMLIVGDVVAVGYYRQHAVWRHLVRLLPWVVAGMPLGYLALRYADDEQMKFVLGVLVLGLIGLRVFRGRFGKWIDAHLPRAWWFVVLVGVLAGFATTLANAAGSIMSVYLLTQGLQKREFVGTGAVFYMIVNLIKLPAYDPIARLRRRDGAGHPGRGGAGHPAAAEDPAETLRVAGHYPGRSRFGPHDGVLKPVPRLRRGLHGSPRPSPATRRPRQRRGNLLPHVGRANAAAISCHT